MGRDLLSLIDWEVEGTLAQLGLNTGPGGWGVQA